MKTIFSLIFISIFLSSNIFAQDPSLSFEGNKIYINNCQWGYFPVMGSIYANHIKMNNASNLDYEIYNKNRKHKTRKEEKEGNWLIMRNDWL